ncbi:hypothetical protein B0O80DRAFT_232514 [Mortierella sp. GBAus27b]|nr:hypothetical protein B0O80DRAFT_232514 [Mortierella sp. GBAus27b]
MGRGLKMAYSLVVEPKANIMPHSSLHLLIPCPFLHSLFPLIPCSFLHSLAYTPLLLQPIRVSPRKTMHRQEIGCQPDSSRSHLLPSSNESTNPTLQRTASSIHHHPLPSLTPLEPRSPSDLTKVARPIARISSTIRWYESDDPVPQLFVVVPTLDSHSILNWRPSIRIVVPCQGPSLLSTSVDSLHITGHDGYTIEYPRNVEHSHRDGVKILFSALKILVKVLGTGGRAANIPSFPAEYVASKLSSLGATLDNKARLDAIGIDADSLFSIQFVVDDNQQKEMEWILRRAVSASDVGGRQDITGGFKGIVLEDGQTIWICPQCLKYLCSRKPVEPNYVTLEQYKILTMRDPNMEVTLCNDLSVVFLTRGLSKTTGTTKLVIHIMHAYFESIEQSKAEITRRKAIIELFNKLGKVISRQKDLIHLEVHGRSANGDMYAGQAYCGLIAIFRCRSLKTLRVSGIPSFLQGKSISMRCRKLEVLSLQDLIVNTEQAESNLLVLTGNDDTAC